MPKHIVGPTETAGGFMGRSIGWANSNPRGSGAGMRRLAMAAAMGSALALAGCAGIDGVELQGGVFDALGMTGSNKPTTKNVKMAPRPGLVLPPSEQALPAPATQAPGANTVVAEAWPVDPEQRQALAKSELDRKHREFCERAISDAQVRQEEGVIMGPKGNCQPGLFGSLTQAVEGK